MKSSNEKAVQALLKLFALIPFMFGGAIIEGYVLKTIWAWFIIAQFGAEPLRISMAIGLAFTVKYFTNRISIKKDDREDKGFSDIVCEILFGPLFALFVGWVIHYFAQ